MKATLTLAATLALFITAIYTVRFVDRSSYASQSEEISCPEGTILFLDFRRKFVCLPGKYPHDNTK